VEPVFFASTDEFRTWLEDHHATCTELVVGFHKKATGKPTLTWSESVDQALCFGWIDGVRRSLGPDAYTIRFTPRKARSTWSNINVSKVERLIELELMRPAGLSVFERRNPETTGVYSFEAGPVALGSEYGREFRRYPKVWSWFERQPPGYRRTAAHWIVSAKKEQTRRSRLATLVADSAAGRKIKPLRRSGE
jgi:uncharacterized protein YdeI (YjbR/CyaY-like superfamily)